MAFQESEFELVQDFLIWSGIAIYSSEIYAGLSWERDVNEFLLEIVDALFQKIEIEEIICKVFVKKKKTFKELLHMFMASCIG